MQLLLQAIGLAKRNGRARSSTPPGRGLCVPPLRRGRTPLRPGFAVHEEAPEDGAQQGRLGERGPYGLRALPQKFGLHTVQYVRITMSCPKSGGFGVAFQDRSRGERL